MKTKITSIIMILLLLTGCTNTVDVPFEGQSFYMGTIITEKIYGKNAKQASEQAMKKVAELEALLTINKPGSEIDHLNEQAGKGAVVLSNHAMYILQVAQKYAALSQGAFDITVGPLVKAWAINTDKPRVLSDSEIEELLKLVNYKDLAIDMDKSTAMLAKAGQVVDLGGIGKGYIGDEVIRIYKEKGINSAYVNLGGNVVALGNKPDGTPWKIGVQNPRAENGKFIGVLSVTDKAVVSSGDYEKFFIQDNIQYHHILDPKTGKPADSGLISTTIVTAESTLADVLSTTTFVLGLDEGMKLIESIPEAEAVFVTKDKKVYVTSGLKNQFIFEDESKEFQYEEKR